MARAGYDPREAVGFWERMAQARGGQAPPEYASTHPSSETRIEQIEGWLPEAMEEYEDTTSLPWFWFLSAWSSAARSSPPDPLSAPGGGELKLIRALSWTLCWQSPWGRACTNLLLRSRSQAALMTGMGGWAGD